MKLKVVTLTTDLNHPGLLHLKASLERHGYDYHIIHQNVPSGMHVFGTQMPLVYEWCKNYSGDCTHILYTDAWDTMALGPLTELYSKVPPDVLFLGSGEKACFPHPELAKDYPPAPTPLHEWKYINGGGWLADIKFFCEMYEDLPAKGVNDQLWLAQRFLKYAFFDSERVFIDYGCRVFQTIGFEGANDFAVQDKRVLNRVTGQQPLFAHGNGRTPMDWVWATQTAEDYVRAAVIAPNETMAKVLRETKENETPNP